MLCSLGFGDINNVCVMVYIFWILIKKIRVIVVSILFIVVILILVFLSVVGLLFFGIKKVIFIFLL